ncbi:unnamed protein product [Sphagnum compactum]
MDEEIEACPPRARDTEGWRERGRMENERENTGDASTRIDEHGRAPQQQQEHGGSKAQLLPRCDSCWAYINCVCDIEKWIWTCAVCGNLNGFSNDASARYQTSQAPEPVSSFIDFEFAASEEFLELVKSSLLAALEARVFAFLSGPPDYGTGQLDTQCYREQYASEE